MSASRFASADNKEGSKGFDLPLGKTAKTVTVSVVIASKNRASDIAACLETVFNQTVMPSEVIVVDQSDEPYKLPPHDLLTHIYDPKIGGLTQARNRAWAAAKSDIIFFIDDDVELAPNCIEELVRGVEQHPDAVGYQCGLQELDEQVGLRSMHAMLFERGFFNSAPIRRPGVTELRRLRGCSMAVHRTMYDRERFDESLVGYCLGEDWEFSQRLRRHGRLLLIPGPLLVHHQSPLNRDLVDQMQRDRLDNFLYFYDKLASHTGVMNRLWRFWWVLGESIRWVRLGLGFPILGVRTRRTRDRSQSLRRSGNGG